MFLTTYNLNRMKRICIPFIALLFIASCNSNKKAVETTKIRDCSEVMVINRMPMVRHDNSPDSVIPNTYYIYKGKRRELAEFDTMWVKKNCNVEVQEVY